MGEGGGDNNNPPWKWLFSGLCWSFESREIYRVPPFGHRCRWRTRFLACRNRVLAAGGGACRPQEGETYNPYLGGREGTRRSVTDSIPIGP